MTLFIVSVLQEAKEKRILRKNIVVVLSAKDAMRKAQCDLGGVALKRETSPVMSTPLCVSPVPLLCLPLPPFFPPPVCTIASCVYLSYTSHVPVPPLCVPLLINQKL